MSEIMSDMLKVLGVQLALLAAIIAWCLYDKHRYYERIRPIIERIDKITEKIMIHFYEKHGRIVYENTVEFSHSFGEYDVYKTSEGNVVVNNEDEIIECPICKAKGLYEGDK